ncbi:hypothetical protein JW964_03675, partial [candidate division KSB1 bacterium]|nr:hypothetical protein [candidate division KSB1 bacterium]
TYVIGSGPFELKPGQSIPFAIASIHGVNKKDLFNNAMLCQILYNNNYSAAEAPPEPNVRAVAGDHSVTLYWNGLKTESAVYADGHVGDKLTGKNAFEGYKIYKSTDRGLTWGETMIDVYGAPRGYIPMAQYDLQNGISGESESRPFFYLGDDTGLRHVLVDNNVENGYEYWYAVLAYDHDDGPIPPLENAFKKDASAKGDNVVAVIPQGKVFGFKLAAIDSYAVHKAGQSDVLRFPVELVDPSAVTGNTYEITFAEIDGIKGFTITDLTTSKIASTEVGEVKDWPIYDEMLDNAPIFDGVKIKVTDVDWGWKNTSWTTGSSDAVVELYDYYDWGTCDDYEIRWTGTLGDSGIFGAPPLLFEIYNITQNAKLTHYMWDDDESGDWSSGDLVMFVEPDDSFTWRILLYTVDPSITTPPVAGDVFTIITNKSLSAADKYQFTTIKETYSNITHNDLSRITTVPNPFVVSSVYETNKFGIERKIQFHFLPPQCTIRIYNIAGDLIQTVEHTDGTAIESWNLLSYNQQEIAFGVYFYHVDAPNIGTYVGKMAIIK